MRREAAIAVDVRVCMCVCGWAGGEQECGHRPGWAGVLRGEVVQGCGGWVLRALPKGLRQILAAVERVSKCCLGS